MILVCASHIFIFLNKYLFQLKNKYHLMCAKDGGSPAVKIKVWRRIMPFVFILFVINMLDRNSISYAALTMNSDLNVTPFEYGLIVGAFFIGFFFFEIPSNLIMGRIGAKIWISRIMISWGVVVLALALAQSVIELEMFRFLLGVAEAGFFPGIVLYFSSWFAENDLARCYSYFIAGMPIAMAIGAPLATWIIQYWDWFGIPGWRWLFIIEGIPAIIAGILVLLYLPGRPQDARWLDDQEKEWLMKKLQTEKPAVNRAPWRFALRETIRMPAVLVLAAAYFLLFFVTAGICAWLPQIVKSFGSAISIFEVGVLLAVPYVAAAGSMIVWGHHSDRTRERYLHTIVPLLVAAAVISAEALFIEGFMSVVPLGIAVIALIAAFPPFWAMAVMNIPGQFRPAGIAFISSLGALGGFFGPVTFGAAVHHSYYVDAELGMFAMGGMLVLCCVVLYTCRAHLCGCGKTGNS
jgi:ACS family tartrate transporter-like MFS transporter